MMFIGSASLAGGTILAVGLGAARRGDSGPDDVDESIDCRGGRVASRSEGVNATAGQFLGTNVLSYRAPASAAPAPSRRSGRVAVVAIANLRAAVQHRPKLVVAVAAALPTHVRIPSQDGLQTSNLLVLTGHGSQRRVAAMLPD